MNHWIFVVTEKKAPAGSGAKSMSARAIFETRMKQGFWGLGAKTPNRDVLRDGTGLVV